MGASKCVKQTLMDIKGEINRNTVLFGGFNTPLSSMDRSSRQKINKETAALNDTLGQMDLIDTLIAFHPKAEEHTFFTRVHGMFSRIDHMLGHKTSLYKFQKTEKYTKICSLKNLLKNNERVIIEIKEEINIP